MVNWYTNLLMVGGSSEDRYGERNSVISLATHSLRPWCFPDPTRYEKVFTSP